MIGIGSVVTTPGSVRPGVVCDIIGDWLYVMWGDNNRQRHTRDQLVEVQR